MLNSRAAALSFALVLSASIAGSAENDLGKLAFENYRLAELSAAAVTKSDLPQYRNVGDAVAVLGLDRRLQTAARFADFDAQIYQSNDGTETFLVYRGSNGAPLSSVSATKDWTFNILQATGSATFQHDVVAPYVARKAKSMYPGITCVGHSLGGANATIGCGPIGLRTVTFNPASLNVSHRLLTLDANSLNIKFAWDFASSLSGSLVGETVTLRGPNTNPLSNHDITVMLEELQKLGTEYERRMLTLPQEECPDMDWYLGKCEKPGKDDPGTSVKWRVIEAYVAGRVSPNGIEECALLPVSPREFAVKLGTNSRGHACQITNLIGSRSAATYTAICGDDPDDTAKVTIESAGDRMTVSTVSEDGDNVKFRYQQCGNQ